MINPAELRIGNIIWESNSFTPTPEYLEEIVVGSIDANNKVIRDDQENGYSYDMLYGIPLTPEWLERLGFKKEEKDGKSVGIEKYYVFTNEPFVYNTIHGYWLHGRRMNVQPKYLHQLQNLYFALTGGELTIK